MSVFGSASTLIVPGMPPQSATSRTHAIRACQRICLGLYEAQPSALVAAVMAVAGSPHCPIAHEIVCGQSGGDVSDCGEAKEEDEGEEEKEKEEAEAKAARTRTVNLFSLQSLPHAHACAVKEHTYKIERATSSS